MEEVIFRGQRVDNKKWVYGYYFKTPLTDEATNSKPEDGWFFLTGRERHCIAQNGCVYEVISETVGRYIGQKDKNRKKIFEDDIVKFGRFAGNPVTGTYWVEDIGVIKWINSRSSFRLCYNTQEQKIRDCYYYEVVGNEIENKELLMRCK